MPFQGLQSLTHPATLAVADETVWGMRAEVEIVQEGGLPYPVPLTSTQRLLGEKTWQSYSSVLHINLGNRGRFIAVWSSSTTHGFMLPL